MNVILCGKRSRIKLLKTVYVSRYVGGGVNCVSCRDSEVFGGGGA